MRKKIVVIALIIVLLGAVSVGAYDAYQGNSTLDVPDLVSQDQSGQGRGQGRGQGQGQGQGQGRGQGRGQGQGQGRGQSNQAGQANGPGASQAIEHEWLTLSGTVVSTDGQSMTVDTVEQGELVLQLGAPGFASQQAVTFSPGDALTILGFAGEDGLFQAGEITNDITGATLHLRDPNGRPLWAGRGQGQGGQGDGSGIPEAIERDWVTLVGTVIAADQPGLTIDTIEHGEISLQLGPPWFASQQEVTFSPDDAVTVIGFEGENGMFQAGEVTNDTTGATLHLRDPNGRPLWAGRGQGKGQGQGQG